MAVSILILKQRPSSQGCPMRGTRGGLKAFEVRSTSDSDIWLVGDATEPNISDALQRERSI